MKFITKLTFVAAIASAAVLILLPLSAASQSAFPPYGAAVSLKDAQAVISAAKVEAIKNKWAVAIVVVDTSGAIVAMERMDDTLLASAQIAIDKARTANGLKRPTKALQDAVTGGFTPILGLAGVTPVDGGLPIILSGKIVGAVGVSGAAAAEDGVVAAAGLTQFKDR